MPNIVIHACKNITEKNEFVENVWSANSALFIYVSTHCVEAFKWLDYNRYSQLTRWCSGNTSALFKSQEFLFCFVFTFCPKTHYLSHNFAFPFAMLIYLVYLTYCKICDRL